MCILNIVFIVLVKTCAFYEPITLDQVYQQMMREQRGGGGGQVPFIF